MHLLREANQPFQTEQESLLNENRDIKSIIAKVNETLDALKAKKDDITNNGRSGRGRKRSVSRRNVDTTTLEEVNIEIVENKSVFREKKKILKENEKRLQEFETEYEELKERYPEFTKRY